jgi:hypothetical protein
VVADPKTQFKVVFNVVKAIEDPAVIQAIIQRAAEETQRAIATAGVTTEETEAAPVAESDRF